MKKKDPPIELPPPPIASLQPPAPDPRFDHIKTDPSFKLTPERLQILHQAEKSSKKRTRKTVTWAAVGLTALTIIAPEIKSYLKKKLGLDEPSAEQVIIIETLRQMKLDLDERKKDAGR